MAEMFASYTPLTLEQRFWSKVDKNGPTPARTELGRCWTWGGKVNDSGYGLFSIKDKHLRAHRVAWEMHHAQPLGPGELVRHMCDNRVCVNPGHLVKGSHGDNNDDAVRRQRSAALRGEKSPSAKLTTDLVQWARQQHASGNMTITELARQCGVSNTTMTAAITRKSWQHVA